jgi:hypothetical protein
MKVYEVEKLLSFNFCCGRVTVPNLLKSATFLPFKLVVEHLPNFTQKPENPWCLFLKMKTTRNSDCDCGEGERETRANIPDFHGVVE